MSKKIIVLLMTFSSFQSLAAPYPVVADPMAHAQNSAREFSIGDDNVEGTSSCAFGPTQGGGVEHIDCEGVRRILVHGGKMVDSAFECQFVYQPLNRTPGYAVTEEDCQ